MKKMSKRILGLLLAAAVVMGAQATVFAAEDDITDEADIYLNDQVITPRQNYAAVDNNTAGDSSVPVADRTVEGTKVSDISNSPALSGSDQIIVNNADTEPDAPIDEDSALSSPNTGMSAGMMPLGIALISLCCAVTLWKKER